MYQFTAVVAPTRLNVTLYAYCLSCLCRNYNKRVVAPLPPHNLTNLNPLFPIKCPNAYSQCDVVLTLRCLPLVPRVLARPFRAPRYSGSVISMSHLVFQHLKQFHCHTKFVSQCERLSAAVTALRLSSDRDLHIAAATEVWCICQLQTHNAQNSACFWSL